MNLSRIGAKISMTALDVKFLFFPILKGYNPTTGIRHKWVVYIHNQNNKLNFEKTAFECAKC